MDGDDDGGSNPNMIIDEGYGLEDNCSKRKRLEGAISPANADVSRLGKNGSEDNVNRQTRFSILVDVEIENVDFIENTRN